MGNLRFTLDRGYQPSDDEISSILVCGCGFSGGGRRGAGTFKRNTCAIPPSSQCSSDGAEPQLEGVAIRIEFRQLPGTETDCYVKL